MHKFLIGIVAALFIAAPPAMAFSNNKDTTCAQTSSCLPNIRMVPTQKAEQAYRVRFVEVVGADRYHWTAGPFFTLESAERAVKRLNKASGVPDKSIRIDVASDWQAFAE